jgi:FAD-NAD(P)-binding
LTLLSRAKCYDISKSNTEPTRLQGSTGTCRASFVDACGQGGHRRGSSNWSEARPAREVAYATTCEQHLLNVPAGLMSALPDEPSHFLDWLREGLGRGYIAGPRSAGALDELAEGDASALIGAGLTAIDLLVEAHAAGRRGTILAIGSPGGSDALARSLRPSASPICPAPGAAVGRSSPILAA